jgi:hypothetical protein
MSKSDVTPETPFDVVICGGGNLSPFQTCIGGSRTAMYPQFKPTTQHGARGVICKIKEPAKIPDFKLSDIPGVRRAN